MHRMWAPWRMEYINSIDKEEGCFLCDIIKEADDRKNLILHRGKGAFVLLNRYPYNSGHLMIAPYNHTSDLDKLDNSCKQEIMDLTAKSMQILGKDINSQGFNCGMNFGRVAGAGVEDHLHMHIVPRWSGDVNFFPIFGDVKSMPEFLDDTYKKLINSFKKL